MEIMFAAVNAGNKFFVIAAIAAFAATNHGVIYSTSGFGITGIWYTLSLNTVRASWL
jgi:hypothetical protein